MSELNKYQRVVPVLGEFTPKDGEPYMPSNGTCGSFFEGGWCDHCKNDKAYRDNGYENGSLGCQILANALAGTQPKEWQWKNGEPVCTAFDDEDLTITNEERAAQLPLI